MLPSKLTELADELSRLPSIGRKTALRLALSIVDSESQDKIINTLTESKSIVKCNKCMNLSNLDVCKICINESRNNGELMVVAHPQDLIAIEESDSYTGKFFVLGGLINPINDVHAKDIYLEELKLRVEGDDSISEVILATNPSLEGEATAMYVQEILSDKIKITRLGYGLSVGSDVEYADRLTISRALESRRNI